MKFKRVLTPSRVLPYLAALTPPDFDVQILDDSIETVSYDTNADVVGITALQLQVPRAIEIADGFRRMGVKVIMGGVGRVRFPIWSNPMWIA